MSARYYWRTPPLATEASSPTVVLTADLPGGRTARLGPIGSRPRDPQWLGPRGVRRPVIACVDRDGRPVPFDPERDSAAVTAVLREQGVVA